MGTNSEARKRLAAKSPHVTHRPDANGDCWMCAELETAMAESIRNHQSFGWSEDDENGMRHNWHWDPESGWRKLH